MRLRRGALIAAGMLGGGGDTTAPSVTGFTVPAFSGSLTIPISTFTASEAGVNYLVTENNTPPLPDAVGWSASAQTTYTAPADGSYALYPWVKDSVGNVSSVYGLPASVLAIAHIALYDAAVGLYQDVAMTTPATAEGAIVLAVADQSGNAKHITQSVESKGPKLRLGVLKGTQPVLRFDGDDFLTTGIFTPTFDQPNMVFVVTKHNSGSVIATTYIVSASSSGGNSNRVAIVDGTPDSWGIYAGTAVASGDDIGTNAHVLTALFNGTSSTLRKDGIQIAAGNPGAAAINGISLAYGGAVGLDGDVAFVGLVDANLSDALRDAYEAYLAERFVNP